MIQAIALLFQVIYESVRQALLQLSSNKLRATLSLLGITIGIWCVIMVFSAVDSLEANIRDSFNELGDDVVYINRMPWGEDPRENFWKYMRRPEPSYQDYERILAKAETASKVSFSVFVGAMKVEAQYNTVNSVFFIGATNDYKDIFNLKFSKGRYFTPNEFYKGSQKIVIGADVAERLFLKNENPIGQYVKIKGQRLQVIGVLEKEGKDLINPIQFDQVAIMPYSTSRVFINLRKTEFSRGRNTICVKSASGVTLDNLKAQLTGVLRARRLLKPIEEDNFALNTLSILSNIFDDIFGVIRLAGLLIGIFAIIVGGFSVANIMFVSVKERTRLIGIKKALGAKQYIILLEFLIESIILCLIGAVIGLVLVYLATIAASKFADFEIFLSVQNATMGLGIATLAGVIAGIIPAYNASKMVPVDAIRS